jgi:hypothetical protein
MLHQKSKASGFNVKFMPTRIGILAVETCPGALKSAYDCLVWLVLCREIKTRSDDRELKALLSIPSLSGPYIAREAEKECRAVIEHGPPTDVSLGFGWSPVDLSRVQRVQHLPPPSLPAWRSALGGPHRVARQRGSRCGSSRWPSALARMRECDILALPQLAA